MLLLNTNTASHESLSNERVAIEPLGKRAATNQMGKPAGEVIGRTTRGVGSMSKEWDPFELGDRPNPSLSLSDKARGKV